jgi:2-methylisocitrate lyase-like PEP mutase family enzyme
MNHQVERAQEFHRLHHGDQLLRLVNVWDACSARVATLAGAPALGTSPAEVASRVTEVLELGAVGVNVEDARPDTPGTLYPVDDQCERLAVARAAADAAGVPMFVNARCDAYFGVVLRDEERLEVALDRARRYVGAGADGVFLPGLVDAEQLRTAASAVDAPVNVMVWPGLPPTSVLRSAGVRRISQRGSSFLHAVANLVVDTQAYLDDPSPIDPDVAAAAPALQLVGALAAAAR